MKKIFIYLFFLIFFSTAAAASDIKNLSKNSDWLKLVHYNKTLLGYKSTIKSKDFFLHKNGRKNPFLELKKTIDEINRHVSKFKDQNNHPICVFPARYYWLKSKAPELIKLEQKPLCTDYEKWSDENNLDSISILFATGYLSNPASYYGHILMRFNSNRENHLLDLSLNYGAIVPPNENGLIYVLRGLFGGYSATFTHNKAYSHNHNYAENDLRDLWSYKLQLNEYQKKLILKHSWELLNKRFTYFFTKQNCAYKMLELIEVISDKKLFNRKKLWMMPIDVFRILKKDFLGEVSKIPSTQTKAYLAYKSSKNKKTIKDLLKNDLNFNKSEIYEALTKEDKVETVESLIKYNRYLTKKNKNSKIFRKHRQKLLKEKLSLNTQVKETFYPINEKAIHKTQNPSMISFKYLYNEAFNGGANIRLKLAYYDFLSPVVGHNANSILSMGDFNFKFFEDDNFLSSYDLVYVDSLNITKLKLKYNSSYAWNLRLGGDQLNLSCADCLTSFASFGLGKGLSIANSTLFSYFEGRFQDNVHGSGNFTGDVRLGFISSPHNKLRLYIDTRYRFYFEKEDFNSFILSSELRYRLSHNIELSLNFSYHEEAESKAGLQFYW